MAVVEGAPRVGIAIVVVFFDLHLASFGIKTIKPEAFIEETRATGDEGNEVVFNKDGAMDGPNGLHHFPGAMGKLGRGGLEFPDESTVGGAEAIDKTIFPAKKDAAFRVGGRGIDTSAGDEGPCGFASGGCDRVEGMFIDLGNIRQASCGDTGAEGWCELNFPGEGKVLAKVALSVTAAGVVPSVSRPITRRGFSFVNGLRVRRTLGESLIVWSMRRHRVSRG